MDRFQSVSEGSGAGVRFPHTDGSRVPFTVFDSAAVHAREQERIYRGPTWSFLGLGA